MKITKINSKQKNLTLKYGKVQKFSGHSEGVFLLARFEEFSTKRLLSNENPPKLPNKHSSFSLSVCLIKKKNKLKNKDLLDFFFLFGCLVSLGGFFFVCLILVFCEFFCLFFEGFLVMLL